MTATMTSTVFPARQNNARPHLEDVPDSVQVTVTFGGIDEVVPMSVPVMGQCDHLRWTSDEQRVDLEISVYPTAVQGVLLMSRTGTYAHPEDSAFEDLSTIGDDDYAACGSAASSPDTIFQVLSDWVLESTAVNLIEQTLCIDCAGGCPDGTYCGGDPPACRVDDVTCATFAPACWPML